MLDTAVRARLAPGLDRAAGWLERRGVRAGAVTAAGLAVGIGACVAAALAAWPLALVLWLANRTLDGLDGPLARRRGPSDLGGMLDFLADFVVYGGFLVGVAIAQPGARVALCVLLAAYLLNSVAFGSLAALAERRRAVGVGDERSLRFTPALAEGTETVVAYCLLCLLPSAAAAIAYVFAAMVLVSVVQRVALARRLLEGPQVLGREP